MKTKIVNLIFSLHEEEGLVYYPLYINVDLPKVAYEQTLGRLMHQAADELLSLYKKEHPASEGL